MCMEAKSVGYLTRERVVGIIGSYCDGMHRDSNRLAHLEPIFEVVGNQAVRVVKILVAFSKVKLR